MAILKSSAGAASWSGQAINRDGTGGGRPHGGGELGGASRFCSRRSQAITVKDWRRHDSTVLAGMGLIDEVLAERFAFPHRQLGHKGRWRAGFLDRRCEHENPWR